MSHFKVKSMKLRLILKIYIYIALILASASCSLDIPYENQFADPNAITTVTKARELLASAYQSLPHTELELSTLSDDFIPTHIIDYNTEFRDIYNWEPQSIQNVSNVIWREYYSSISSVNALQGRLKYISATSEEEIKELDNIISEAKILKAYCYYQLLQLFAVSYDEGEDNDGIVLKNNLEVEYLSRSSIKECVTAIQNLLLEASKFRNTTDKPHLFSQMAADYLLADLALYRKDYDKAAEYALKVIESKDEKVLGAVFYSKLWSDNSCDERIFLSHITTTFYKDYKHGNNNDVEKIDLGDYFVVNDVLVKGISVKDIRREQTFYEMDVPGEIVGKKKHSFFLGKYNKMNREKREIKYVNKIRLSGAYFILAEAYCLNPKVSDKEALKVINTYLKQRDAELFDDNLSGNNLMQSILLEKWKEFVGEGVRYQDIKRYRKTLLADWGSKGKRKTEIKRDDYRWTFPIPESEYINNEHIVQNKGWAVIEK